MPSQLNDAEFPSNEIIITEISDYIHDKTGGPREQLAVHPTIGQFIFNNAATTQRHHGFNSSRNFLVEAYKYMKTCSVKSYRINLINGYLSRPSLTINSR